MNLQSEKKMVQQSQQAIFERLSNPENFEALFPENLEEFSVKEGSFKFKLKGMPAIRLAFKEKRAYDLIKLKATSDDFPVFLNCHLQAIDDAKTEVQLTFDAEINAMMAMMIKKPIQNLLDTLVEGMAGF